MFLNININLIKNTIIDNAELLSGAIQSSMSHSHYTLTHTLTVEKKNKTMAWFIQTAVKTLDAVQIRPGPFAHTFTMNDRHRFLSAVPAEPYNGSLPGASGMVPCKWAPLRPAANLSRCWRLTPCSKSLQRHGRRDGGVRMAGLESNRAQCLKKKKHTREAREVRSSIRRQSERKDCFVSAYSADELGLKYIRQRAIF